MLQLQYGKALEPRESLVIFDEVQRFPIAREYIKHLVEDGRFDYIETGSLVSIKRMSIALSYRQRKKESLSSPSILRSIFGRPEKIFMQKRSVKRANLGPRFGRRSCNVHEII